MSSPKTVADLLRRRAHQHGSQVAFRFLADGESSESLMTYRDLDQEATRIARLVRSRCRPGERVLLLYAPGLEYVSAFFGCLYAGVIAVPAYPPDPFRLERSLPRLRAIASDSGSTFVLTTVALLALADSMLASAPELRSLGWLASDGADGKHDDATVDVEIDLDPERLAFLQYTSGSTGSPKGVMLSHGSLLANLRLIHQCFGHSASLRGVIWLPPYHDMGLIGGILSPVYAGGETTLFSPLAFLERPMRWLRAVSTYRATTSGGPNFAYDLCVRKSSPEDRAGLDLSGWDLAFTGAEPIRSDTLDRFVEAFGPCGFRREAFYPCYGLAEGTLIAAGGRKGTAPRIRESEGGRKSVGSGRSLPGHEIAIIDPDTRLPCGWLPDGTFRHLLAFDSSAVEKLFRAEVLRLLVARGKISEEVVENLLTWRHSGFSVHAGVRVEERSEAVRLGPHWIRYWHPLPARARAPHLGRDLR